MKQYVSNGMLPGIVPVRALEFYAWDLHFVITSGDLFRRQGEATKCVHNYLLRILHNSLRRARQGYHFPLEYVL